MEKEEFEREMDALIRHVEIGNFFTCGEIKGVFGAKAENKYIQSIRRFFVSGAPFIDWGKLDFANHEGSKKREFRRKLLEEFRDACIENKFYKEL